MLHQTVIPIPTNPPAHRHPVPEQTTTSTDRPLGRYCGHVFLYGDTEHFLKTARKHYADPAEQSNQVTRG